VLVLVLVLGSGAGCCCGGGGGGAELAHATSAAQRMGSFIAPRSARNVPRANGSTAVAAAVRNARVERAAHHPRRTVAVRLARDDRLNRPRRAAAHGCERDTTEDVVRREANLAARTRRARAPTDGRHREVAAGRAARCARVRFARNRGIASGVPCRIAVRAHDRRHRHDARERDAELHSKSLSRPAERGAEVGDEVFRRRRLARRERSAGFTIANRKCAARFRSRRERACLDTFGRRLAVVFADRDRALHVRIIERRAASRRARSIEHRVAAANVRNPRELLRAEIDDRRDLRDAR